MRVAFGAVCLLFCFIVHARTERAIGILETQPSHTLVQSLGADVISLGNAHFVLWEKTRAGAAPLFEKYHHPSQFSLHDDARVSIEQVVERVAIQYNLQSWGLARISQRQLPLQDAFAFPVTAGEGIEVYVLDTGVNINHVDLGGRAQWGINTVQGSQNRDINGHGTTVAGVIAGTEFGVAKRARIIAVKALNDEGGGTLSDILYALDYINSRAATRNRTMSVVNLSIGTERNDVLSRAVDELANTGIVTVVAAGNGDYERNNRREDACNFSPANAANAITVGATDQNDVLASFSTIGRCVDLFAPGVDVETIASSPGNNTTVATSGTSLSAPHVAGVAALILSEENATTVGHYAVKQRLLQTATRNVLSRVYGSPNRLLFAEFDTTANNGSGVPSPGGNSSATARLTLDGICLLSCLIFNLCIIPFLFHYA
ncbi:peptidase S8/S53 domain-containing protein [Syncephalastrum racemosum]|uniref:Peptidase S8/S53 domain-containing protein n=1 Tax=Syncephalastrum racemosum TaxID=13706 RepID=A0A1X2H6X3_SYNRA|nr:peptidase S8/S53 domain-containing protein [Syncephalastrum racemosum]